MNIKKIEKIITRLSKLDRTKIALNKNGGMDLKKFNEMEEVKKVVEELKVEGVKSSSQLMKLGFVPAGMILTFNKN
jgi:hypothetical protein